MTLRVPQRLQVPSTTIPFELFGQKITVVTTGNGAKVSIKLQDLGKFIAREYLGQIIPASRLTELLNSVVDIKFSTKAAIKIDYKKPKKEGLKGLMLDVMNNQFNDIQNEFHGTEHGPRMEIWNTVDDLTGGRPERKPTDPIKNYALKIVGNLEITPKTPWLPFSGKLKLAYSAAYTEYVDRIEIHLSDITIGGGIKYRLDVTPTISTESVWQDPQDPFVNQYPRRGTSPRPIQPFETTQTKGEPLLEGKSKIKALSFKEELNAATFTYNRQTNAYGFMSIGEQKFRTLLILVICVFLHMSTSFLGFSSGSDRL